MLFKILINYITGYVNIVVEGFFIERFINKCISKNIAMWNIKRKNTSIMYANIGIKDFKKLKHIAKDTKCRVSINHKKGMPFIANKYRKRKIFASFLLFLVAIVFILSNFIWNIEIVGNENISQEEIQELLTAKGLTIGKLKNKINTKNIINDIRLERDDIAWLGINVSGTNARVEIVEAKKKPEIIDKEDYCNIVSDKDGVITKITAKNGTLVAKVGDVVRKGSLLIGGWIEGKYTGTRYLHSEGEIEAKVWYSKKDTMELKQNIEVKTRQSRIQN